MDTFHEQTQDNSRLEQEKAVFNPINEAKILQLKDDLEKRIGLDLTEFPVHISNPGEFYFDLYEAQTKLYQKIGDWKQCVELMVQNGYSANPLPPDADKKMRAIAESQGIVLDGTMPGFVYSVGGAMTVYLGIPENQVMEMAIKYAGKEGEAERAFPSLAAAKEYLQYLAEKYFYHETGHAVYDQMLNAAAKKRWRDAILANKNLVAKIMEVQKDKHPNPESIPVADEAFADIFAELTDNGLGKNRLGEHPRERDLALTLLRETGFEI